MGTIEHFIKVCEKCFRFLTRDYDFQLISTRRENWGHILKYKSDTVGVVLTFEYRELYLFVQICRLINGEFPPRTGEMMPDTVLNCFDLNDIVALSSRESMVYSFDVDTKIDAELLELMVQKQADNLKQFAKNILKGDFSLFPELDKIVKERARMGAIEDWGKEKAREFGWDV